MSQQYDVKKAILALMKDPQNQEKAIELFMHATEWEEEDFEYEHEQTIGEYLFGQPHKEE